MKTPKILIIGKRNSGKTTFSNLLAEKNRNWKSISTSDIIRYFLAQELNITEEEIIKNKEIYRIQLVNKGNEISKNNPAFIVEKALQCANIVNGVRLLKEYLAVEHFFDFVFYISRPQYELNTDDNFEIFPDKINYHLHINNSKDLENLNFELNRVYNFINRNFKYNE